MTLVMRWGYLPFFIITTALFVSTFATQAAEPPITLPTYEELMRFARQGLLNGTQIEILLIGNDTRGNIDAMMDQMNFVNPPTAPAIYLDAVRALDFARSVQNLPYVRANPSFPDSLQNIREYYQRFSGSINPEIRADIELLRLMYDPASRDAFTAMQRRIAELRILSRDPETLRISEARIIAAQANERYRDLGISINTNSVWGNWKEFLDQTPNIPTIRAQQDAMRNIIMSDPSLLPNERAFALTVLTTMKDGKLPPIEKTAREFNIPRRTTYPYQIISQIRETYAATTLITPLPEPSISPIAPLEPTPTTVRPPQTLTPPPLPPAPKTPKAPKRLPPPKRPPRLR